MLMRQWIGLCAEYYSDLYCGLAAEQAASLTVRHVSSWSPDKLSGRAITSQHMYDLAVSVMKSPAQADHTCPACTEDAVQQDAHSAHMR